MTSELIFLYCKYFSYFSLKISSLHCVMKWLKIMSIQQDNLFFHSEICNEILLEIWWNKINLTYLNFLKCLNWYLLYKETSNFRYNFFFFEFVYFDKKIFLGKYITKAGSCFATISKNQVLIWSCSFFDIRCILTWIPVGEHLICNPLSCVTLLTNFVNLSIIPCGEGSFLKPSCSQHPQSYSCCF